MPGCRRDRASVHVGVQALYEPRFSRDGIERWFVAGFAESTVERVEKMPNSLRAAEVIEKVLDYTVPVARCRKRPDEAKGHSVCAHLAGRCVHRRHGRRQSQLRLRLYLGKGRPRRLKASGDHRQICWHLHRSRSRDFAALVHSVRLRVEKLFPNAERHLRLADLQGATSLCHRNGIIVCMLVDGNGHTSSCLRAMGRRVGAFELRCRPVLCGPRGKTGQPAARIDPGYGARPHAIRSGYRPCAIRNVYHDAQAR